jgi:hypothetical protein
VDQSDSDEDEARAEDGANEDSVVNDQLTQLVHDCRKLSVEEPETSERPQKSREKTSNLVEEHLRLEILRKRLEYEERGRKRKATLDKQRAKKAKESEDFSGEAQRIIDGLKEAEEYAFPNNLTASQRAVIHHCAEQAGISHETRGTHNRELVLIKKKPNIDLETPFSSQNKNVSMEPSPPITNPPDIGYTSKDVFTSLFTAPINHLAILNIDLNIEKSMLVKDPNALSDAFLNDILYDSYSLDDIKGYFQPDAFDELVKLVHKKRKISKCRVCKAFCYDLCICCDSCGHWLHYKCENVSHYHKSGKSKKWLCSYCKN